MSTIDLATSGAHGLESTCDQLFESVIVKLNQIFEVKPDPKSGEIIDFFKKLYANRCKLKIDCKYLNEAFNEILNAKEKQLGHLVKICEYLKARQKKHATLTQISAATSKTTTIVAESSTKASANEETRNDNKEKEVKKTSQVLTNNEKRAKVNLEKLAAAMNLTSRHIRSFEEKEISLDELDSAESAYITESKLKERFTRLKRQYYDIVKKHPNLVEEESESENDDANGVATSSATASSSTSRLNNDLAGFYYNLTTVDREHRSIYAIKSFDFTRYKEINEKLKEYFRRNREFPEYNDVKDVIDKANLDAALGLSSEKCASEAKDVFEKIGKILKSNRLNHERKCLMNRLEEDNAFDKDPASNDSDLVAELNTHKKEADEKLKKIIDEYGKKQELGEDYEDEGDDEEEEEESKTEDIGAAEEEEESGVEESDASVEEEEQKEEEEESKEKLRLKRTYDNNFEVISSTTTTCTTKTATASVVYNNSNEELNIIKRLKQSATVTTTENEIVTTTTTHDFTDNLLNKFKRSSSSSSSPGHHLPIIANVTSTAPVTRKKAAAAVAAESFNSDPDVITLD